MIEIKDMTASTFWKGEAGVKALVLDGDQSYKVSLSIKAGQVYDYSCTCAAGNSYKGMCPHAKALWAHYQEQRKAHTGKTISTSQEIRSMIREYTNHEVAQIIQEGEVQHIHLAPRLILRNEEVLLEFKIGRERMYILKDLVEFAHAVETGAVASYGKQLEFHHSVQAFVPEDRPLVEFLTEQVNVYEEYYAQFQNRLYVTVPGLRALQLSRGNRDRFFELMKGRMLEVEAGGTSFFTVEVTTEQLPLDVKIQETGCDGIAVSVAKELYSFSGERGVYLVNREKLVRLDEQAADQLRIFLGQMFTKRNGHCLEINKRDVPLFMERVLKKILPYTRLDTGTVNLDDYRTEELRAKFSFDSPAPGTLTMRPELSYGTYTFVPMEDEKVPRTITRDVPGEFRISQVITRYFKYRDTDGEMLIIRDEDDALYRLLKDGIPEFMALGEVYVSEEAKKVKLLPPPPLQIGVKFSGNWLEFTVDAEGMSQAELTRILFEYDPAKPYYRLKNGEFLELDENGLMTVAQMVKGLSVSKSQLAEGTIKLPGYRALYLDSLLKDSSGITLYRDQLFRAVVRGMKSVEDSMFALPDALAGVLRSYQKTGFRWLKTLDAYGFGGILADDMGLGKTIQVITLLLDEKIHGNAGTSLIVCPASLIFNWENEIHRFAPELKVQVISGTAAERENQLRASEHEVDVLVTSYDLLKRDIEGYRKREFRFEIIDEAQYIKNPATQSAHAVKLMKARTRFALTGTPVENRISELWSIFDYLMPGFLFGYQKFKQSFELPIVRDSDEKALRQLRRLTGPFILRRMKKDVLKDLPEKQELVLYSKAEEEQKRVYNAHAMKFKEELEQMDGSTMSGERFQILAELTRLRELCCDPALCLNHYKGGSAKLETLISLLQTAVEGGHKILVFSQFTTMLDRIADRLKKEKLEYHMLTGATPKEERIRMAGAFQIDSIPIFLISLKAGGTGLNLTAADIVVHFDPWWNVAAQNQATDRTHRIGQERQVTVYQMILKDTIEENIRMLQEQKRELAEQIITEGTISMSSLTREDLIGLLD